MTRVLPLFVALAACSDYSFGNLDKPVIAEPFLAPAVLVEPAALAFGQLGVDCVSAPRTLTITNVGDVPLEVTGIELGGVADAEWRLLGARPGEFAPGASMEARVRFAPIAERAYGGAQVRVLSDDPSAPVIDVPLSGLGSDQPWSEVSIVQAEVEAVDVLWVIDNSASMADEVDALAAELGVFVDVFTELGLDWQLGVVTTDLDDPAHQGRLRGPILTPSTPQVVGAFAAQAAVGVGGSPDEQGLEAAVLALSSPLLNHDNAGFLREHATLAVIVLSDEDDNSEVSKRDFSDWLGAIKLDASGAAAPHRATFSAIAGPDQTGLFSLGCPLFGSDALAAPAPKYAGVTRLTGGVHVEICEIDFAEVLGFLSSVAAGLQVSIPLPDAPADPGAIEVTVDGVAVSGWSWDGDAVVFDPDGVPEPGAEVVVGYERAEACQ